MRSESDTIQTHEGDGQNEQKAFLQHEAKIGYGTAIKVMHELTNLALTCQEMSQLVIDIALPALEERVDKMAWERFAVPSAPDGRLPPFWNDILQDPTSCKLSELKVSLLSLPLLQG